MSLFEQFYTAGMMLCSGLILGALFDAFRVVYREFKFQRWIIAGMDILYWIAAALLVFRMLYISNAGEIRYFIFLALVLGVIIHFTWFSQLTQRMVLFLIHTIQCLIRFFVRCFQLLVIKPIILLYQVMIIVLGLLAAITIFFYKFMVQCIYPFIKITVWLMSIIGLTRLYRWIEQIVVRWIKRWKR